MSLYNTYYGGQGYGYVGCDGVGCVSGCAFLPRPGYGCRFGGYGYRSGFGGYGLGLGCGYGGFRYGWRPLNYGGYRFSNFY